MKLDIKNLDVKPGSEVLLCQSCGFPNIVKNVPFKRRKKKNRHLPLDDEQWFFLGKMREYYGTYSNAISVLIANAGDILPIFFKPSINISLDNKKIVDVEKNENE